MGKTAFHPQTHGFAFVNSWKFDFEESEQMQRSLSNSVNTMSMGLDGGLSRWVESALKPVMRRWAAGALPEYYGLCGGMACAALDYYLQNQPLPRGTGYSDVPTKTTPEGAALRRYLTNRQLESMALNFPKLLLWMGILHVDLPLIEDDGPRWLRKRSRNEWEKLKRLLDGGSPWPLMLIGTSTSPFHNHQVLAYGYEQTGEHTGTIYVYDMNCPDRENTIRLDFSQKELVAEETCADQSRGPLRGFFCNAYNQVTPPRTVTQNLPA